MQTSNHPVKVISLDLNEPVTSLDNLDHYAEVQVMVRLHGAPLGYIRPPIINGRVEAVDLVQQIVERHGTAVVKQLLRNGIENLKPGENDMEQLFRAAPPQCTDAPLVTVAVCTRDRTEDLALCLEALSRLEYPALDLLVVNNAPSSRATEILIHTRFPQVRHIVENRPGLDWARNRAAVEARGEIIAYTDDDVIVDPLWVRSIVHAFADHPDAGAVTGLVAPFELETESQVLFEAYGGFGRGFTRRTYQTRRGGRIPRRLLGAGQFGTGANMAYRRSFFEQAGLFDPALDVGTVTNGGGDLEMFHRVLKAGYTLVYEPNALVFHRHRRDYDRLRVQLANNGVGFYSYLRRTAGAHPEDIPNLIRFGIWWFLYWNCGRLWRSWFAAWRFPRDLIIAELRGCFIGLRQYPAAQRTSEKIIHEYGAAPVLQRLMIPEQEPAIPKRMGTAVRNIDLSNTFPALEDIKEYSQVQVFLSWRNQPLGQVLLQNRHDSISKRRLVDAAVMHFGLRLLDPERRLNDAIVSAEAIAALRGHLTRHLPASPPLKKKPPLPVDIKVSVVVATYDRPEDLRQCLRSLATQVTSRMVEIIVVDNHPASGLTSAVVKEFADVILIQEPRQGLSNARNAGFLAATGEISVATDDDVTMPSDWLENILSPFAQAGVMAVTGNVLPVELETKAQHLFENYGGLGRGYEEKSADGQWFDRFRWNAVPTWKLGATANAAFRTSIFSDPQIGLMYEPLGAGMPTGCSEDTYLFYKIIKNGHTLYYEPAAWVWHKHRRDMTSLRRQIYNYSKGHVAYHLTTAFRDRDRRALLYLCFHLPRNHTRRLWRCLWRKSSYPLPLVLLEIWGNLNGPWALFRSILRVRQQRRNMASPEINSQDGKH